MSDVGARLKPREPPLKAITPRPCIALLLVALSVVGPARGEGAAPTASVQQIRSAAAEYDAGRRAFVEKDYDGAAAHFENAFNDAPSAEAIRSAIRAQRKAGHLARAATLAEVASQRYPKDAATAAIVRATLTESASKLHKVTLRCSPDCGVAADGRAITLADSAQTVFFLEPGSHDVVVSWSNDRTTSQKFSARAGGKEELDFEAPPAPAPPAPPARVAIPGPAALPSTPSLVAVAEPVRQGAARTKPLGPAIFIVGAALTAGGIGFVTWSGINAESSPGTAAVLKDCAGLGPSCPAYQEGLASQLRTNIALGVTGGVALTTALVGIFFTQWSPTKAKDATLALRPAGAVLPGGFSVGVTGGF
jgi:hypothetical protein